MAIPFIAVGDKIKASIINKIVAQVNLIALNGIVPTSVESSGGTVTVAPNGKVSFANVNTVSLNGVLSGSYDNYRITWNSPTRSANGSTQLHLRSAGVDTNSNYDYVKGVDAATARTVSSSSSSSAVPLDQGVSGGQSSDGVLDLFGPAIASKTTGTVQSAVLSGGALYSTQASFAQEDVIAFDGITLFPLSGATWTGIVRVYGYNNLT